MGKINFKIVLILLLFAGVGIVLNQVKKPTKKEKISGLNVSPSVFVEKIIDNKATFAIFTNGTFRIFSDSRYHNLSADVFIQANNANVIHVKKAGITWDDFFKTLPMNLTQECLTTGTGQVFCTNNGSGLKFYLNGVKTENFLQKEIMDGDKALISYGLSDEKLINQQLEALNEIDEK